MHVDFAYFWARGPHLLCPWGKWISCSQYELELVAAIEVVRILEHHYTCYLDGVLGVVCHSHGVIRLAQKDAKIQIFPIVKLIPERELFKKS
jgi:hypothetical protein